MASTSSSAVTPMTLITIKVNYDGSTRRFKLPLKDVGINSLENKLREVLKIPDEAEAVFERYSDSAACFVTLDQQNISVYKQLYRAAKAKQKLKLRVTVKKQPQVEEPQSVVGEEKEGPKPASVSDEAEEEAIQTAAAHSVPEPIVQAAEPINNPEEKLIPVSSSASDNHIESLPEWNQYSEELDSLEQQVKETRRTCAEVRAENEAVLDVTPPPTQPYQAAFAVCCNACENTIPEAHYHCSTCDEGDFDLCQDCVDLGATCYSPNHWLIKRFIKNGKIVNSTTERLAPKEKQAPKPTEEATPAAGSAERIVPVFSKFLYSSTRTCNCCVQELPEVEFVHCETCDDYDLCKNCFSKGRHGHHPKHAFVPAVAGSRLEPYVARRLAAGRGQVHNAICDGCDKAIIGIRHKCLDCPDWDYCNDCVPNSPHVHPGHRFVPVYEPLELLQFRVGRVTHTGICCDGPLCAVARKNTAYIVGDRFKCAVCHDTDFCEACEASPANSHNKTHPLIKFKTPVRHVSVTTTGENQHGRQMPMMGDRPRRVTRATETVGSPVPVLSSNVQTVIDVKPSEPIVVKEEPVESKAVEVQEIPAPIKAPKPDLVAVFVKDTIPDGTLLGPDHVFEQTWVLRNAGQVPWPAGCSVKFVGGDYMGHVDSSHPAATRDIEDSNESTICHSPVPPGEERAFTVLLRTPLRSGRLVSNWRLTTADGNKFGHRLWCDIVVDRPKVVLPPAVVEPVKEKEVVKSEPEPALEQSQMIFPKLEKESPMASMIDTKEEIKETTKPESVSSIDYEDCDDEDWDVAESDEGFLTDEEYDILDASDEEYIEARARK
ncbi:next to BRCA1 gene 1 protein [Podospora fimiseda]|uniref:Next to BRCA1 gene 1 protein n=1 Tax=Podospora fimiseda TaxID=252190 RepID=A0AAN7H357_9PEZI|nr:next to BRCA1 gene 1 protein [Podospora fimiseda]